MSDHEVIRELIAAYALDALDADESTRVQEHLTTCAGCRMDLEEYARVCDGMAVSAAPAAPPQGLEQKILREASLAKQRRVQWIARAWNPALAAAAAMLIIVLGAGNVAQWVRSPQFQARSKGLVTVALVGTGEHKDAYGTMVVDTDDNEGVLAVRGLPRLGPESRYQLWLMRGTEVHSGGLFQVSEDGYGSLLIKIPGGFRGFRSFSISVEPAQGSPAPGGTPVLMGGL